MTASRLSVDALLGGLGDRAILARAITLIESARDEDRDAAEELLARLPAREAVRVGVSGVPGVGKSTLIDALGMHVIGLGQRVAVLAVDPSSALTGGSILGDKTRMPGLSASERAFIRPSPSETTLGGVARRTRETMLLCEAAGYGVILVETVGVGQSETAVADMVDTFLLLALPGAGDELQGIKRGILELADVLAVNKADGENRTRAERARAELSSALPLVRGKGAPPVLLVSGQTGEGVSGLWEGVLAHRASIDLAEKRAAQRARALEPTTEGELVRVFWRDPRVRALRPLLAEDVARGTLTLAQAARRLLRAFRD